LPVQPDAAADRSVGEDEARVGRLMNLARALRADADAIQAALSLAERRFQATFLHAPVGIAHVGLDGAFLAVNPRFAEITGRSAETLMRTGFQQITHPDDLDTDVALLARLHAGEIQRYTMEKRYLRADGSCVWINLTVAMVRDDAGQPDFYVAVIEDMSNIRQAHFEAIHDPLTELLNRRGFTTQATRMIARAAEAAQPMALVYLDLDGFKALNDRLGHSAGDRCLIDIARLMEMTVGSQDAIARMGGDEFILLLSDCPASRAAEIVERLRAGLVRLADSDHGVSGSFGLLTFVPDADSSLDALIRRADEAMLNAKRAGRNQVILASAA
jgi:diguanylate cyclase (GGDEF)-like protein/PAS domain S-box-containing protein